MRAVAIEFALTPSAVQRHRPHLAGIAEKARAAAEIEELAVLYRRIRNRGEKLASAAEEAREKGQFAVYASLMLAALKHDESLMKLGEKPGYRTDKGGAQPLTLNAPDARIVVTTTRD